jgi:hypothetical protein
MRKIFLIPILALVLLLSGCFESNNYLPLKVGNTWYYTTNMGNKVMYKITRKDKVNQKLCYVMESSQFNPEKGSASNSVEDYLFPDKLSLQLMKRYFLDSGQEFPYDPAKPILHYPLTPGKIWRWKGKQGEIETEYTFKVEGSEKLHSLGKNFNCLKISMTSLKDKSSFLNTRWYANGVGIIKESSVIETAPGQKIEMILELTDYTLK